jgi:predicted MPP superfamily phosphohydrolase
MKKKHLFYIAAIIALVGVYLLLLKYLPKNVGYLPVFLVLVVFDLYLWNSLKNKIFRFNKAWKYVLSILYWLPFALLFAYSILSAFVSPLILFSGFSIYVIGLVFTAFVSKLVPVLFLIIADISRLARCAVTRFTARASQNKNPGGKKISRSRFLQNLGLITGGIVMSGFIAGMAKWATDFKIWNISIRLKRLPDSLRGLRIVQISDLHLGSWPSKDILQEAVDSINSLDPDLVFFTGDIVNYVTEEAYPFENILKQVKATYAVYTVLGNHDYGDYTGWESREAKNQNMADLYDFYNRIGWKLLRNENEIIDIDGYRVAVIGVENWSSYDRFPSLGDLSKAADGTGDADIRLLLSHDPTHWEHVVSKEYQDIEITFSGHTHGFQFGIDNNRMKWSPAQYLYKYWSGLYSAPDPGKKQQYLYVNRGIGNIGYPGRIGILPEITFLELS